MDEDPPRSEIGAWVPSEMVNSSETWSSRRDRPAFHRRRCRAIDLDVDLGDVLGLGEGVIGIAADLDKMRREIVVASAWTSGARRHAPLEVHLHVERNISRPR